MYHQPEKQLLVNPNSRSCTEAVDRDSPKLRNSCLPLDGLEWCCSVDALASTSRWVGLVTKAGNDYDIIGCGWFVRFSRGAGMINQILLGCFGTVIKRIASCKVYWF